LDYIVQFGLDGNVNKRKKERVGLRKEGSYIHRVDVNAFTFKRKIKVMKQIEIPIKVGSRKGIISLIQFFDPSIKDEDLLKMSKDELFDLYIKLWKKAK